MRPSEIAQLRCRDILDFRGEPHFRYAPFAPEETEKQRFDPQPGGMRGKTKSAYRWIAIHRLLLKLGIVEHRDATPKDKPAMPLLISELRNFKEVARAEYGKTSYLSGGGLFCGATPSPGRSIAAAVKRAMTQRAD